LGVAERILSLTDPVSPLSRPDASPAGAARQALDQVRATAREQLHAAWQLYAERVQQELERGWPEHLERVIEERFAEIARFVDQEADRRAAALAATGLEEAAARGGRQASRKLAETLNQAARRLRNAADSGEWVQTLLETALRFSEWALLFAVSGEVIRLESAAGAGSAEAFSGLSAIPLAAAPAFRNVIDSRDTVIALASPEELSAELAGRLASSGGTVALLPVTLRGRVAAVLCAPARTEEADFNTLELVAALATAALEARPPSPDGAPGGLVLISGARPERGFRLPPWSQLSKDEQDFHIKAQRFARVRVAELRLYQSEAVKEGRAARDLYARLKSEIDAGREAFRTEFMNRCPSMVDYFHLELVRTLANDDETLLGSDYPGPLV